MSLKLKSGLRTFSLFLKSCISYIFFCTCLETSPVGYLKQEEKLKSNKAMLNLSLHTIEDRQNIIARTTLVNH